MKSTMTSTTFRTWDWCESAPRSHWPLRRLPAGIPHTRRQRSLPWAVTTATTDGGRTQVTALGKYGGPPMSRWRICPSWPQWRRTFTNDGFVIAFAMRPIRRTAKAVRRALVDRGRVGPPGLSFVYRNPSAAPIINAPPRDARACRLGGCSSAGRSPARSPADE